MKDSIIFKQTTQKLYSLVNDKRDKNIIDGIPYFTHLDIKLEKTDFYESEWIFLTENEDNFKTTIQTNEEGRIKSFPVYKIENDNLFTNELNVQQITTKYNE